MLVHSFELSVEPCLPPGWWGLLNNDDLLRRRRTPTSDLELDEGATGTHHIHLDDGWRWWLVHLGRLDDLYNLGRRRVAATHIDLDHWSRNPRGHNIHFHNGSAMVMVVVVMMTFLLVVWHRFRYVFAFDAFWKLKLILHSPNYLRKILSLIRGIF